MRKFIVTILSILYITSATGATIHMHYCMGKLVEWGFWKNYSQKCSSCGMEKNTGEDGGCCKDEQKQLKLDKDQKITDNAFKLIQSTSSVTVITTFPQIPGIHFFSVPENKPPGHAPPRSHKKAVYLRNCVFLI